MIALQVSHDIARIMQRGGIECKLKYEFLQFLLGLLPAPINVFVGVHSPCKVSSPVLYILLYKPRILDALLPKMYLSIVDCSVFSLSLLRPDLFVALVWCFYLNNDKRQISFTKPNEIRVK